MNTRPDNLFCLLRQHALAHAAVIATHSIENPRRRPITYKRFWARIERATARLQGEWHIASGDTVAYWGGLHADALILYIALARCGAKLLPLDGDEQRTYGLQIMASDRPHLLVFDGDCDVAVQALAQSVRPLSSLLAVRCHHDAVLEAGVDLHGLIAMRKESDEAGGAWVPDCLSLQQLCSMAQAHYAIGSQVNLSGRLFDPQTLVRDIFPALCAAATLNFP